MFGRGYDDLEAGIHSGVAGSLFRLALRGPPSAPCAMRCRCLLEPNNRETLSLNIALLTDKYFAVPLDIAGPGGRPRSGEGRSAGNLALINLSQKILERV
jgi:hypothetical protein